MNDIHRSALNSNMIIWWENCYCTLLSHFVSCLFPFDTLWSLLHIINYPMQKFWPLPGCYWKVLQVLYSDYNALCEWTMIWNLSSTAGHLVILLTLNLFCDMPHDRLSIYLLLFLIIFLDIQLMYEKTKIFMVLWI